MRCLHKPKNKLKLYLKKRLGKTSLLFVRSWLLQSGGLGFRFVKKWRSFKGVANLRANLGLFTKTKRVGKPLGLLL
ncbi:hypothetical protein EGQ49_05380 [Campylobacter upsaliensis]|nr:hypothetical protein [Campylobacter upsaliensis]EAH6029487.1 hypothetical protein [Campylobacter upsaliensis]